MADTYDQDSDDDASDNPALDPAPDGDPKSARQWLALIKRGEKAFEVWHSKCDSIDRLYANLEKLASDVRDREFQIFWANVQVIGPSIYSRPPVPVVVPAFRDQRPLRRTASELLERCAVTTFRIEDIDSVMRALRDDMVRIGRGAPWLRYSTENGEKVCIEHINRKDFLHDPARGWKEVDWVAKRSWLTKKEGRQRFRKTSGDEYKNAAYAVRKDDTDTDGQLKAGFWELWSKSANKVVWVAEGCDKVLDEGEPHLTLDGFFPTPRPAISTTQPDTLLPIPDVLFYKDQLEEINQITARIASLSQSLQLKGFYPAGAGEIGDAIEAALKTKTDNVVLVPISNWAALGGQAAKDMIVWLPLDMIATTVNELIQMRRQLIDDVYQITGISDIMRGDTEASETLGAQQLKSQYGSIRVRDRQQELVRLARDITGIASEIIAENFSAKTLLDMSQMGIPSKADVAKQVAPLQKQLKQLADEFEQAKADPEIQQLAQQKPDAAKQAMGQVQQQAQALQQQIAEIEQTVTIEQIVALLRDNHLRPFTLDIETDSTIAPDEAAQQQRAAEFVKNVGGYIQSAVPTVEQVPQAAPVVAAMLKFVAGQFRVGREIEGIIDKFADQMTSMAAQPKGPTPAQQKQQSDAQAQQMQAQLDQANLVIQQQKGQLEAQKTQASIQLDGMRLQLDRAKAASDAQIANNKNAIDATKHAGIEETKRQQSALDALVRIVVAEIAAKQSNDADFLTAVFEEQADLRQHDHDRVMQANEIEANQASAAAQAAQPQPGASA